MRRVFAIASVLATIACATPELPPRALPTFERIPDRPEFAKSEVARRAWQLYQIVSARRIAQTALPKDALVGALAAIDSERNNVHLVRFCAVTEAGPSVLYDVAIPEGPNPEPAVTLHAPPLLLGGEDLARFHAQAAWLKELSGVQVCGPTEAIAVRNDVGSGWLSYLVPVPDQPGFMMFGGFHLLEMDETASFVTARKQDPRRCAGWHIPSDLTAMAIAEPEPRTPDISDVYISLLWDTALFISNTKDDTVWAVDDAGVTDFTERFRKESR
jgi:hypothetical protein